MEPEVQMPIIKKWTFEGLPLHDEVRKFLAYLQGGLNIKGIYIERDGSAFTITDEHDTSWTWRLDSCQLKEFV